MSEENIKSKSKLPIIITVIILILVVGIVGGYFGYQYIEENKSTGTEWGDNYLEILAKDTSKDTYKGYDSQGNEKEITTDTYANSTNCKIQFIKYEENEVPSMFISFEKNGKKCIKEYTIKGYDTISSTYPFSLENEEELTKASDYELQYLYNIKSKQYNWYIKETDKDKGTHFFEIKSLPREVYDFSQEEMQTNQVAEDGSPIISKFEETFIVPEIDTSSIIKVGDIHNIKEKVLKKYIKTTIEEYKDQETLATEEIKIAIQNKITELESKKEQIKVAQEEKLKKDAEEKARIEEENRKKAEEETQKKASEGLKVGNYTLKYGTYVGYDIQYDPSGETKEKITMKLNANGTYTYNGSSGTYTVKSNQIIGTNGMPMTVTGNNKIEIQVGAGITMTYQGN